MPNPYTLSFGFPPPEIISRQGQVEHIVSEFCRENPANYINLVTGVRGSGKTVFITQVSERMSEKDDWIVVDLNSQRDLLTSLAAKLDSNRNLSDWFREAEINLQFFGLGVEVKGAPQITDIEYALTKMLQAIKKHKKRVLVTIDEAVNSKEMRAFASAYQIFLREKLPIFLIMTGLFKDVNNLRNATGMTFLERAPRTTLAPLDQQEIVANYEANLKTVSEDEAIYLAKASKGYSFAFQVLGYYYYEFPNEEKTALKKAKQYLYEFAYEKIWSETSPKDKEVIVAISKVPTGEIIRIRELLDYSSNQFNPYRARLIKAGILSGETNGVVKFALPFFDEFALKMSDIP